MRIPTSWGEGDRVVTTFLLHTLLLFMLFTHLSSSMTACSFSPSLPPPPFFSLLYTSPPFLLLRTQKPTTASGYISAHMTRVHDLDWSYTDARHLTTCSHDASVKFWDTTSTREPTSSIKTGHLPVWRARNYVSRDGCGNVLPVAVGRACRAGASLFLSQNLVPVWFPCCPSTGHSG